MSAMRTAVALTALALTAWGLAASTGVVVPWHAPGAAMVRLSWTARPERIETCRELSADELAARPAHMRRAVECTGGAASYLLYVALDGVVVDSAVITGGGLRHDRPLHLLRNYPLAAGPVHLTVRFDRREETAPPRDGAPPALPPSIRLDTLLAIPAGRVALVTLDGGTLVVQAHGTR